MPKHPKGTSIEAIFIFMSWTIKILPPPKSRQQVMWQLRLVFTKLCHSSSFFPWPFLCLLLTPSTLQHSSLSSSTSAAECSRPCCPWLDFQGPDPQGGEREAVLLLPAGSAGRLGMADSCWPCPWTAAGPALAALPGHVWNGPAVMYCAAFHLIYAYLWKAFL